MDEFLASITAAKNRWFNQGGYTPVQLVFGELPRVPAELLSEDQGGLVPLSDAYHDPAGLDESGAEFRKRIQIRERAKQAAMEQCSREALSRAVKTSSTPSPDWRPGQWVYVFRRGRPTDPLVPKARWVGPGMVLVNARGVVWVAMRSRLWRCSPEQLRAAFPTEVLGHRLSSDGTLGELLRQVTSGNQSRAVDVAREGPPTDVDELAPVSQVEGGIPLGESVPLPASREEDPQAPQAARPVPSGLLPRPVPPPEVPRRPSVVSSRRSSATLEEPAQEPEGQDAGGAARQLPPVREEPEGPDLEPNPGPTKVARVEQDPSAGEGTASSSSAEPTRAPGTPIGGLMNIVRRSGPTMPGTSPRLPGRERSPRRADHTLSSDDGSDLYAYDTDLHGYSFLAKRNDEISLKELSVKEKELFAASDELEWSSILKTKAVRVVTGKEADRVRACHGSRIISSRMVRRRKPLDEIGQWKAKSRWCLHGHSDPDTGSLVTYAPTPQVESIMTFLQAGVNLGHHFAFSDIKNAFCQSDKLRRPNGPLYALPCEGLPVPEGALIEIIVPVYGLDDAPAAWRATITKFLVERGFIRNLIEPCWFMRYDQQGRNTAQILVEVDDLIVSADPAEKSRVKEELCGRFVFGKWDEHSAEYAGRRVISHEDHVSVDQEKYIIEQVHPIPLAKGRRKDGGALSTEEFTALRSAIYRINWVSKETRPELCGLASIMASRLPHATVDDILITNKAINHLRNTAGRALRIWKFHPGKMTFLAISDAGGINTKDSDVDELGLPADATQGAWMVLAAEDLPVGAERVRATPLAWRSSKLKRKVFSTFGGETQAMLQGINETDWLQIMYRDAVHHDVQLKNWRHSLSPHMVVMRGECELGERQRQCSVTDAKSLYDCILKEHPQGRQDRKASLELAIIVRDLEQTKSMVRWVPHQKMIVDSLTKLDPSKANGAMEAFLKAGYLSLVDVQSELASRASDSRNKRRSHSASVARLVREYQEQYYTLWATLIWGYCNDKPVDCVNLIAHT